jgi:tetratricopeptide (TPR) repeat protein
MKKILPIILAAFLMGCLAEEQFVEEEVYIEEGPQWTAAQIDSIIKINRMFFFDYYRQMERKNEFPEERCKTALSYFWEYINFDTENKYNDFPQAGRCYFELAKNTPELADSVIIMYEMGITRFPDSDYLHFNLGRIYKNRGDLEKAKSHYLKAIAIDSTNTDYIIPLTEIYQQEADWVKAKDACEKVLALDPGNSVIRDRLETILRDNFSQADYIAILKDKISHEPENIENRLKLIRLYIKDGNNKDAEIEVQEALKINPRSVESLQMLGIIKQNHADYNGAADAYKKILEVKPEDAVVMLEVADCYKNLKNYSAARKYIMDALKNRPGFGSAYLKLGEVYLDAADNASKKKSAYSDKLIYTIAYGLFVQAASSDDYEAKDNANRKKDYLSNNQFLPQKSDWFMHQKQTTPKGDAYRWINHSWSEVRYIKTYLKKFTG